MGWPDKHPAGVPDPGAFPTEMGSSPRKGLSAARRRLSYANVTSTLALFLVIAGGVLEDGAAVTAADINEPSLQDNAVKGTEMLVPQIRTPD